MTCALTCHQMKLVETGQRGCEMEGRDSQTDVRQKCRQAVDRKASLVIADGEVEGLGKGVLGRSEGGG